MDGEGRADAAVENVSETAGTKAPSPSGASAPAPAGPGGPPPAAAGASGVGWLHAAAARRLGGALLVIAVAGSAVYGANLFGLRDRVLPVPKAPTPVAHGVTSSNGQPVLASEPWWQPVTTLSGTGGQQAQASIPSSAVQWRAQWTCDTGHLTVTSQVGRPVKGLIDSACPGKGTAIADGTGAATLAVSATGAWRIEVDAQVDTPIDQTPLPQMTAPGASLVSTGSFYSLGQTGHGTVSIYRLADGSYALRLDSFYVTPNSGLQVQLSSNPAPKSDSDVSGSQVAVVADMVQTAGSMNFTVPSGIDPTRYRSVAIWCVVLRTVYSAATLGTP